MRQYLLFLLGMICFLAACQNTTSVEGTVQNARTGVPVPNARINLRYSYSDGLANTLTGGRNLTTDANGKFTFIEKDHIWDAVIEDIVAEGFATKFLVGIEEEACSKPIIELDPLDEALQIKVENTTGMHDSIWVSIRNDCEYLYLWSPGSHTFKNFPIHLDLGGTYSEILPVCRNKTTIIKWAFDAHYDSVKADTLLIPDTNTLQYSIVY